MYCGMKKFFRFLKTHSVHYSVILPAGIGDMPYIQTSSSDISANINIHTKWDKTGLIAWSVQIRFGCQRSSLQAMGKHWVSDVFEVWKWWVWDGAICSWVLAAMPGKAQALGALGWRLVSWSLDSFAQWHFCLCSQEW